MIMMMMMMMILEYCSGGELFDRITPDRGMDEWRAQKFFKQIISGVAYLHRKGVAHRDIKPENILLDSEEVVKIADFGMSTIFRHKGVERKMNKRCGSLPYLAPEVHTRDEYHAEPVDVWSCGVVLVAMLTGELPWDKATNDQREYNNWKEGVYHVHPWKKIDNLALSLLRKILMPWPSQRYKVDQIQNHIWVKKKFKDGEGCLQEGAGSSKRLCNGAGSLSQPLPADSDRDAASEAGEAEQEAEHPSFTQPAHLEHLLMSTQGTTQSSQAPLHRLVKRMTR